MHSQYSTEYIHLDFIKQYFFKMVLIGTNIFYRADLVKENNISVNQVCYSYNN